MSPAAETGQELNTGAENSTRASTCMAGIQQIKLQDMHQWEARAENQTEEPQRGMQVY